MVKNIFNISLYATIIGSAFVSAQRLITNCKPGHVALAYDDGPFQYTSDLIDYLDSQKVKATFFVNGRNFWWVDANDDAKATIKKAYASKHQIASHTWSHTDLTSLSAEQFDSEITNLEDLLEELIHQKPAFLRPPYGAFNDDVISRLGQRGYDTVTWSADSKDFESHSLDVEKVHIREAYNKTKIDDGFIILAHDVFEQTTTELTKEIIRYSKAEGFKFATVAECVGKNPYQ